MARLRENGNGDKKRYYIHMAYGNNGMITQLGNLYYESPSDHKSQLFISVMTLCALF